MKRFALVAVLTTLAGSALAAREGGRGRGKQPAESLFDQLVRECKLTQKQQADVKAKIKVHDEALAKWDKANADKIQAAETALKDARDKKDDDARKKASGELKELRTARDESAAEATAAVFAILTAEQKVAWAGHELCQSIVGRYRRADLSDQQLAKIKSACTFAAKELGEAGDDDRKAKRDITNKIRWGIEVFVLTDEQREALAKPPQRGGKKDKQETPTQE
jgi:Spy/CpxP family protein refolding chaperone